MYHSVQKVSVVVLAITVFLGLKTINGGGKKMNLLRFWKIYDTKKVIIAVLVLTAILTVLQRLGV